MNLGSFHNVVGVSLRDSYVSILDSHGTEKWFPVRPPFNRKNLDFDPIKITGEFGDFSSAINGFFLQGMEPQDVTEIDIHIDYMDDEFHTRKLSVTSANGTSLEWDLYCEND